MDYKVLYRKYRPLSFDDVTGQKTVVNTLKNAIVQNKISHAYIFTGPRGTGKTSLAKIFARSINCENNQQGNPCLNCNSCKTFNDNPDIIEIDAASNNGVDEIRELINNIKLLPSNSKYKVYIIDEVHMLSQSAFNALLLTLEEPPAHVVFILATTDIQNVPITILSRTQRFDFSRISVEDICNRLTYVCSQEKIKITPEAITEIAYLAEGGLRDALSILDQIASLATDEITIETVINTFGTISNIKIKKFIDIVESNDIKVTLEMLQEFKNSGIDSKVFINKLINELKELAINIKLNAVKEKRLTFEKIKSLILELTNLLANKSISIDPYIIVEMIVLSYMNANMEKNNEKETEYFLGNNKKTEISQQNNREIKIKAEKQKDLIEKFKEIRVNNCLAEASKQILNTAKLNWQSFLEKVKLVDNNIYLNVCDTDIVAASDDYVIIETLTDSSAGLINKQTTIIERVLRDQLQLKWKIIAVSKEEWKNIKTKYIEDIKKQIKYEIKEEILLEPLEKNELENLASDIFSEDKIEIVKE